MPAELMEVTRLFLKLGLTAFGGPAAHIAMYRDETVTRRGWLSDQEFLDLLGVTNLIPGPNSTEMAIHLGLVRAGWAGLVAAGVCFILPAALITTGLAWMYVKYGATPEATWLLYGVKPVMIAIIFQALVALGQKALHGPLTLLAGVLALVMSFSGLHPIAILLLAGGVVFAGQNYRKLTHRSLPALLAPWLPAAIAQLNPAVLQAIPYTPALLFVTFLKIGAVLYGSGYVLLAFMHADFVTRLGWLTDQQLLEAIAIGQVTPGPVFTTATFVGYLLGGAPGAFLGTLGIFLPSFIFVSIISRYIPRLRSSPLAASLLDGVNAASLGLMAAVAWQLGRASLVDPATILIALGALIALYRFKLNTTWLVLAGGAIGFLLKGTP
jgi:chromate transporter